MQTIKCECGEELLVIPSIKAMHKAVSKHLKTCPAQKNSEHDLYFVLVNKMVDAITAPIISLSFHGGNCFNNLQVGGSTNEQ